MTLPYSGFVNVSVGAIHESPGRQAEKQHPGWGAVDDYRQLPQ